MPIYSLQGPDGRVYDLEAPEGTPEANLVAALEQHLAQQPEPIGMGAKIKQGFGRGLESLISTGVTAAGSTFGSPEEAAKAGLERQQQIQQKYPHQYGLEQFKQTYQDQGLFPAATQFAGEIPAAIAEQVPNIGSTIGGSILGSALGGVRAGATFGPFGAAIGGIGGALLPSLMQQFGGNVERQAQEQTEAGQPLDINRSSAFQAALPQAGLDVAATFIPLGGRLVSKITGIPVDALIGRTAAQTAKLAEEGLMKTLAKGTAVGALAEIPTEVTQQMLQRWQAGLPLADEDAYKEYGETAFKVSMLAPIGAAGRLSDRSGARQDVARTAEEEQVRLASEQRLEQDRIEAAQAQRDAEALQRMEEYKQTPEYSDEIAGKYQQAEKAKADLLAQVRPVQEGSLTATADQLFNKSIQEQAAAMQPELDRLAREYNEAPKPPPLEEQTFTPEQYQQAVSTLNSQVKDQQIPAADAVNLVKQATGIDNDQYASSLLDAAVQQGDVAINEQDGAVSIPSEREGLNIEQGFEQKEEKPTGFNVVRNNKVVAAFPDEKEAKTKLASLEKVRTNALNKVTKDSQVANQSLADSQGLLDNMQAYGKQATPEYAKAVKKHQVLEKQVFKKLTELNAKQQELIKPFAINPAGVKKLGRKTFTVKEEGATPKAFYKREDAEKAALAKVSDDRLNAIITKSKAPKLVEKAKAELTRRQQAVAPKISPAYAAVAKALQDSLSPVLKKFGLDAVSLEMATDIIDNAEGSYSAKLIRIALDADNPLRVLRHESIHALKELGFFSPSQWKALEAQAKKVWVNKYLQNKQADFQGKTVSRLDAYKSMGLSQADILEESIADAFADFDINKAPAGFLASMLNKLRSFFAALGNAMRGAGFTTAEDIFGKIEGGKLKPAQATAAAPKFSLAPPMSTKPVMQATPELARETLGLKTKAVRGQANNVREIASALNRATIAKYGKMSRNDLSDSDSTKIALAIADEVEYQLTTKATTGTGLGWYSNNYPNAVKRLASRFPELKDNRHARSVFSALVAVTSNGEKVTKNIDNAVKLYAILRDGQPLVAMGNRRATALENNLKIIEELLAKYGTDFESVLLKEITVKDMNVTRRQEGLKSDGSYLADTKVPAAAVYFGPKLGAFYANLSGSEGYLTMDLWWTRSINRMRGLLMPNATEASISKFRDMMNQPDATREEVIAATIPARNKYEEYGWNTDLEHLVKAKEPSKKVEKPDWFKKAKRVAGPAYEQLLFDHNLEKMANTIYKNEYQMLEEAPFTATDRKFMYEAAYKAQALLRQKKIDLTLADIQAALWYYEKRLYQHLSGRKADDIGYEEAIIAKSTEGDQLSKPSVVFDRGNDGRTKPGGEVQGAGRSGAGSSEKSGEKLSLREVVQEGIASWTPKRIKYLVDDFGYSDGRTKGYAAWVNPRDFIKATTLGDSDYLRIFEEAGPLREDEIKANNLPPRLYVEDDNWKISGHEGRHRMAGLAAAGVKKTPVLLVMRQDGYTTGAERQPFSEKVLGGQKFQDGRGKDVFVEDLTPLTYEYTKELANKFGKDSQVKYSLRDKLGMYSELENKIASASPQASAETWKGFIKSLPTKGVKPEEIEWSGVNDWLDLQKGKVTRQQVLDYLKQGGVKVEETVLGEMDTSRIDIVPSDDGWNLIGPRGEVIDSYPPGDMGLEDAQRAAQTRQGTPLSSTRYAGYVLPGGNNYREVLLTLPKPEPEPDFAIDDFIDRMEEKYGKATIYNILGDISVIKPDFPAMLSPEDRDAFAAAERKAENAKRTKVGFQSNHWNEENVLAHIRLNDRTDVDGKRVLFVEELQSDWGQEGKKKGFLGSEKEFAWDDPAYVAARAKSRELGNEFNRNNSNPERQREIRPLLDAARAEERAFVEHNTRLEGMLPNAPFVSKTEGWLNLALKRVMVMAAEGGYDKVAFVNGEQSADRYKLSETIDSISWFTEKNDADSRVVEIDVKSGNSATLSVDKSGLVRKVRTVDSQMGNFKGRNLDEIIGKEFATKILSDKKGDLDGDGLNFGGEGMKAFYDKIVPMTLKKLLPKVDGGALEMVSVVQTSGFAGSLTKAPAKGIESDQPGFTVTPAMRDRVQTTGLPRFSLRSVNPELSKAGVTPEIADAYVNMRKLGDYVDADPEFSTKSEKAAATRAKTAFFKMAEKAGNQNVILNKLATVYDSEGKEALYEKPEAKLSLRAQMLAMPNGQAIMDTIDRTTTARQEKGFVESFFSWLKPDSFSKIRQEVLNRYEALSVNEKRLAKKMGGIERLADSNAESAALMSDLAAGVSYSAFGVDDQVGGIPVYRNGHTFVSNEQNTVKGPFAIFAPLAKYNDPLIYQMWQTWAGSKRASRFLANGKEQNYTAAEIAQAQQLGAMYPEFQTVHDEWIKYNDGLVKYLVDTGVLSAENGKKFREHSDYVPFYRQIDGEQTVGPQIFQALSNVSAPRKIKGSDAPIADFFETIVRNTQAAIQAGMKNTAAVKAVETAEILGDAQKLNTISNAPNTVTVLKNGMKTSYQVTDILFLDAMKSLNMSEIPFLSIIAAPANLLRSLITKEPGFIIANLMRDSMSAYVTSGAKMTNISGVISNFGNDLFRRSDEAKILRSVGIGTGYEFSEGPKAGGQSFKEALMAKSGQKSVTGMPVRGIKSLWGYLEKISESSDLATRVAVYKDTLERTGNEAEAKFSALAMMNFNRRGRSPAVRLLTAAIPFLNARMQGLDVFYRAGIRPFFSNTNPTAYEKQIQKAFMQRGLLLASLSVFYAASVSGDEEYEKQEEETKDNYWLLPSLGVKIPIPHEVGFLFKTIPERIYRASFGTNTTKDLGKSLYRGVTSTLGFNPIPQAVLPITEAVVNYSFFTNREIVGGAMSGIEPKFQVGPSTSLLSKQLGEASGLSPMKIDHIIKGYTGTMGMYMADVMDSVIDSYSDVQKPSKRFEQTPVLRRFLVDPEARGNVTAFYDLKNSVDETVRTINLMEKTGNPELADYMQENEKQFSIRGYVNNLNEKMKNLQRQALMVRSSTLKPDEKRDLLKEIGNAQNALSNDIKYVRKLVTEE
jgi:hypothetical protein